MTAGEYRIITVDGNPGDWSGIPPIVTDPEGDGDIPEEDIKAVYAANDEDYLYFLMEIYPYTYVASQNGGGDPIHYIFHIDNDPDNGEPEFGGADYRIIYTDYVVLPAINEPHVELQYFDDGRWFRIECEGIQGEAGEYMVEVRVPWDCIGGKGCFESFFMVTADEIFRTDIAPDTDEKVIITTEYCACSPPVGGELVSQVSVVRSILTAAVTLTLIAVGVMIPLRKQERVNPPAQRR